MKFEAMILNQKQVHHKSKEDTKEAYILMKLAVSRGRLTAQKLKPIDMF